MIASDIHGSAAFCRKLMTAYERERAERMLLLGDVLYHGPRNDLPLEYDPRAVIGMLNPMKNDILCVRGNCDTEVDQMVLEFPVLADYAFLLLDGLQVFATHGHVYNTAHLPPLHAGDLLLHGHTHVPAWEKHESYLYFNPGSVSIPKAGSPNSYMMYEDRTFVWRTLGGETFHEEAFA